MLRGVLEDQRDALMAALRRDGDPRNGRQHNPLATVLAKVLQWLRAEAEGNATEAEGWRVFLEAERAINEDFERRFPLRLPHVDLAEPVDVFYTLWASPVEPGSELDQWCQYANAAIGRAKAGLS